MKDDNCSSFIPSIHNFSQQELWALRITNSCLALPNIFGNSFLIYALKRTGQLSSMSLQLIVLMSASDCISGITALTLTNVLLWKEHDSLCYLKVVTQFIHHVSIGYSFTTVLLIAADRFLHIKYLQRYPIIVTRRKGLGLCLLIFILQILAAFVSSMPFLKDYVKISKLVYISGATLIIVSVIVLYYKTVKIISGRVSSMHNPTMQSTMTRIKAATNSAWSISLCMVLTLTPYIICSSIVDVKISRDAGNSRQMTVFKWFTYLGSHTNGVCSCIIFIAQNRPVRRLLQGMIVH